MKHTVNLPEPLHQRLTSQKKYLKKRTGSLTPVPVLVVNNLQMFYDILELVIANESSDFKQDVFNIVAKTL